MHTPAQGESGSSQGEIRGGSDGSADARWAEGVAERRWGVRGRARPLEGERDLTYLLEGEGPPRILKATPPDEDRALLACQDEALDRLTAAGGGFRFPRPVADAQGRRLLEEVDPAGARRPVRLLEHVPGRPLAEARPVTGLLLEEVGTLLGTVDRALEGFDHPAAHRELEWDPARGEAVVAEHLGVHEGERRARVEAVLALCAERLSPRAAELPTGIVHGDGNAHNVLVEPDAADPARPWRVTGLVDFGDLVHSWLVGEPAVAGAYAMMERRDPVGALSRLVAGYHRARPLGDAELEALYPLALLRLAVSVTLSARRRRSDPDRTYLFVSEAPAWALLERLSGEHPDLVHYTLRDACGLVPCPRGARVARWLAEHPAAPGPVLDPDPRALPRTTLDLKVGSGDLRLPAVRPPGAEPHAEPGAAAWARAVREHMEAEGAAVAVGRWDEPRRWYATDAYRVESDEGPLRRTVHIGVDLFAPAGTPVRAALDGTVAAVRHNDAPLDYGPTVVLRHEPEAGLVFHTLHGHLDRATLEGVRPGDAVARGEVIGRLGDIHENGGWAPHLHLQIVADTLGMEGDFPGVCRPDRRDVWTSISPDPNLLLRLPEGVAAPREPSVEALQERRGAALGPNLSVAYRRPLHVVRGWRQHLYDAEGRPYLDCVNNVAHVGHAHPRVADAIARQAAVLDTNSRYLHRARLAYVERLLGLFPEPLRVCWLVCSGSEANELALRLARAHTGRRDVVVLEGAYHGNTGTLVAMSPYKFRGPGWGGDSGGGGGAPEPWVHPAAMPDSYRGAHRDAPPRDAAEAYAADVRRALAEAEGAGGEGAAAFFAEAILSCGGQVEPPPGYLAAAFRAAREAGAVCVADEVQVGLGRVGSHWWGFETQDALPDIVTLGKPLGNGHPLAAVVTTRDVAEAAVGGMEYFNTFGGSPVACAAGAAVLDVMEEEGLRAHAREVGAFLEAGLRGLAERHALVGDVRGRGLFLGVELVLDRETREPAPRQTAYVVERARALGVLLSSDGPDRNVLKIKPPLPFGREDADLLLETLDGVLEENAARP